MGIKVDDQDESKSERVEEEEDEEREIPTGFCPVDEDDNLVEAEPVDGGYGCPECGRVLSEDSLREAQNEFWNHAVNTRFKN